MKLAYKIKKGGLLIVAACLFITACNKAPLPPAPIEQPMQGTTPTLSTLLDAPEFTFLKAAVTKAGLMPALSAPTIRYTVFAPDNNAFIASGIPSVAAINSPAFSATALAGLLSYHVIPQVIASSSIPATFPNFEYPSILNPTTGTPGFNPLVRLTNFPSKRGSAAWVNNVPVTAVDALAVNGVLHKVAILVAPPTSLTAQTVRGIVVYHILGTTIPGIRVFSVNLPSTATQIKTLLNQAVPVHPGVTVQATFAGPFVAAATVKGLGNATASNIIINPLNPFATDQNYVNGVMMRLDQVLMPL